MKFIAGKGFIKPLPFLVVTICLLMALVFIVKGKAPQQLPPDILGRWYSADPRYQDCSISFSTDSLIIGGADGNFYHYTLRSVREEAEGNSKRRLYTLLSTDHEGVGLEFRLSYDAEAGNLSYANQRDVVWRKRLQAE